MLLHRCPAEPARADDPSKVAFHESDPGALHRDVRSGAHRDAHVSLRERRRVVDAVSGHRDAFTTRLQTLDHRGLLIRQDVGFDLDRSRRTSRRLPRSCDCRR